MATEKYSSAPTRKVQVVQFGILSPEDIVRGRSDHHHRRASERASEQTNKQLFPALFCAHLSLSFSACF